MQQNTDRWHQWRKGGLGSSDAPVIMGVSPYKSLYSLFLEKIEGESAEQNESSYIMNLGHRFEPKARAHANLVLGFNFRPDIGQVEKYPWLRASFDGIDYDAERVLEIKLVGKEKLEKISDSEEPLSAHYPQLQHQLMVSGFAKGFYAAYTLNSDKSEIDDIVVIPVSADKDYIEKLFDAEQTFWFNYVLEKKQPELSDGDAVNLDDAHLVELSEKYRELKQKEKEIKAELESVSNELKASATHPLVKIGDLKLSKVVRKGSVDTKKLSSDFNIDLDNYRKEPSVYWKIT